MSLPLFSHLLFVLLLEYQLPFPELSQNIRLVKGKESETSQYVLAQPRLAMP